MDKQQFPAVPASGSRPSYGLARIGLCALLITFATTARATPLNFVDGVDGTLTEGAPFPVLSLGTGANTVSGTGFAQFATPPFAADFDSFEFTVPVGTMLDYIGYSSTVTGETNESLNSLRMEAFIDGEPSGTALACQEFYIVNKGGAGPTCFVPPGNTFGAVLPLYSGTYLLYEGQYEASDYSDTTWNYTWTLNVDPVPEPGTLALVGTGLAMGLGLRRRKRAQ